MTSALLRVAAGTGVATLTLDSPHNRNALSTPLIAALSEALAAAVADPAVRVIVLSHTGPVFCAGADLKETAAAFDGDGTLPVVPLADLLASLWESPKPIVARVGGPARAGGIGLIAAADIVVCAEEATFAFSEVRLGVIPAVISVPVRRRISARAAAELFLTGDVFSAARAAEIGLVTRAVPADALDEAVEAYCASLIKGAPAALAGARRLLQDVTVRDELARMADASDHYFRSAEGREGILAFREKRAPTWVP
ncbi:enoyl-CoA hydratase-related protein [Catenuloplanes atrovinosus]|uniref:Methylglutaconyl-CoA hydratase n=1 Tax=Catenuloplanes atrovinosus TaxID=137266 RepID=A0AAE3YRM6_9ACTN|nr:enoyl-CoA hydratase-related protein [Catenuloplanes atrovinosus]MDR7278614.1 methylglutaconyl-CoA hydratase [Catenuloplanes atrovinosus]